MSEYTIELHTLLQTDFRLDLDYYPIFDESYRPVLNQKIIDHYLFHEIGLETPDQFNHFLKTRMNEIMPYYNDLYRLQLQLADPFKNVDITETTSRKTETLQEGKTDENASGTTETNFAKGKVISHGAQSDTPQSNLTPYNIAGGGYASLVNMNETKSDDDQTTGSNTLNNKLVNNLKNNSTDDYVRQLTGYQNINKMDIAAKYKKELINIDLQIINELRDLFMIVY